MNNEQGHILVVDDDPLNLLRMSRDLGKQGHTVVSVHDGPQALAQLRAESFDVVLLDIIMPEMDGRQVLHEIKQDSQLRDIPVIVISALDDVDSVVECIEKGAEDYLTKPFRPALLRARLNASLGKKKLRDLEVAYLQQEMALRQSEKLATLGKLSAGMAHELNNPAAAARRGVDQLRDTLARLSRIQLKVGALNLSDAQFAFLEELRQLIQERAGSPAKLDPITRSDREHELATWLDDRGVEDAWECAPTFVSVGYGPVELLAMADHFTTAQFPSVMALLSHRCETEHLLEEIGQGTARIAEIVNALKSYSYMDQAPVQRIDVHQGLDDTLVMLHDKLGDGITVRREYAENLPRIQAYGSELNQVWTNILDNAIGALEGQGAITVRTNREEHWLVVEISDTGPGIPGEIQPRIFDPFFTTKPPGTGAGLGLTNSHRIIVEKHKGKIAVRSKPGETVFEVRLPLDSVEIP